MRLLATTYSSGEVKSEDLSGAATAGWMLLIALVPLVGVACHVVARGDKMKQHQAAA